MTLYEVKTSADRRFFWAGSKTHALEMFNEQAGRKKNAYAEVDRVWADNNDARYRGYVVQEDE